MLLDKYLEQFSIEVKPTPGDKNDYSVNQATWSNMLNLTRTEREEEEKIGDEGSRKRRSRRNELKNQFSSVETRFRYMVTHRGCNFNDDLT